MSDREGARLDLVSPRTAPPVSVPATREHIRSLLPAALAESPPRRGPSLRERRRELRRTLRHAPGMSDRAVAKWCCVSRELVATTRAALVAEGLIGEQPDHLGADGKRYKTEATQRVSNEGGI